MKAIQKRNPSTAIRPHTGNYPITRRQAYPVVPYVEGEVIISKPQPVRKEPRQPVTMDTLRKAARNIWTVSMFLAFATLPLSSRVSGICLTVAGAVTVLLVLDAAAHGETKR